MAGPETTADGSRLSGTNQVLDLAGRDVSDQHTAGWNLMLDKFAADLVANPRVIMRGGRRPRAAGRRPAGCGRGARWRSS